jgi:hypothetical protein
MNNPHEQGRGALDGDPTLGPMSVASCKAECLDEDDCDCIQMWKGKCFLRTGCVPNDCQQGTPKGTAYLYTSAVTQVAAALGGGILTACTDNCVWGRLESNYGGLGSASACYDTHCEDWSVPTGCTVKTWSELTNSANFEAHLSTAFNTACGDTNSYELYVHESRNIDLDRYGIRPDANAANIVQINMIQSKGSQDGGNFKAAIQVITCSDGRVSGRVGFKSYQTKNGAQVLPFCGGSLDWRKMDGIVRSAVAQARFDLVMTSV